MTSTNLLDEFIRHLRIERGLAQRTEETYLYHLKSYAEFLTKQCRSPAEATRDDVLAYLERRKNDGLRGASIFAAAIAIRQFQRFLFNRGAAACDPTTGMRLPRYKQRLPEPLTNAEMEKLLAMPTGGKFHLVRIRAALQLLYSAGLRASELVGLKLGQLDIKEGWVRAHGKGGRERILPLGPRTQRSLADYLSARQKRFPGEREILFLSYRGRPISRTDFWRQLRELARRAGLKTEIHPHKIRHSAATRLMEGGANLRVVQEFLGHRSVLSTQRYTHVSAAFMRRACEKAHPQF
ncbi:MAG: tyrosine-type recombinase/integrase [Elusimicrobia bacterium]|nr:tyrosine-type recombinase/integrase [Elusimicrobiota bacterium]